MSGFDDFPSQDELLAPVMYELGKVLYLAQQLETNLLMLSAVLSHNQGRIDADTFKRGMSDHESLPLGSLAKAFGKKLPLPSDLADFIREAVEARNSVVHGFVLRNTIKFRTEAGRDEIVQELREAQHIIERRRQATEAALGSCLAIFGGSLEQMKRDAEAQILEDVLSKFTRH